jgi:hypothetical protein
MEQASAKTQDGILYYLISEIGRLFPSRGRSILKFKSKVSELNEYKTAVKLLAAKGDSFEFLNSGNEHAGIVMSTIFQNASDYIYVFAGSLKGDVSQYYLVDLENYLNRPDSTLKVILQTKPENPSPAVLKIWNYIEANPGTSKVEISYLNACEEIKHLFSENEIHHFTIADNKMFRIEEDLNKYTARVSFNNKKRTSELKIIFNELQARTI